MTTTPINNKVRDRADYINAPLIPTALKVGLIAAAVLTFVAAGLVLGHHFNPHFLQSLSWAPHLWKGLTIGAATLGSLSALSMICMPVVADSEKQIRRKAAKQSSSDKEVREKVTPRPFKEGVPATVGLSLIIVGFLATVLVLNHLFPGFAHAHATLIGCSVGIGLTSALALASLSYGIYAHLKEKKELDALIAANEADAVSDDQNAGLDSSDTEFEKDPSDELVEIGEGHEVGDGRPSAYEASPEPVESKDKGEEVEVSEPSKQPEIELVVSDSDEET